MADLLPHGLSIALLQPQIAPNTGNIARLCVATATPLHLVRPLGFVLSDKALKRSAMDYWSRLTLTIHDDNATFLTSMTDRRLWLFSTKGTRLHWNATFGAGDVLVFGSETKGIDESIQARFTDQVLRIPQTPAERCLNLATAAGIGLYEAIRQTQR